MSNSFPIYDATLFRDKPSSPPARHARHRSWGLGIHRQRSGGVPAMTIRTTAQITAAVLVACVLLLVVFDLYMAANNVPGDTISEVVRSWAARHPVIPFAAGVVMGHFFW